VHRALQMPSAMIASTAAAYLRVSAGSNGPVKAEKRNELVVVDRPVPDVVRALLSARHDVRRAHHMPARHSFDSERRHGPVSAGHRESSSVNAAFSDNVGLAPGVRPAPAFAS